MPMVIIHGYSEMGRQVVPSMKRERRWLWETFITKDALGDRVSEHREGVVCAVLYFGYMRHNSISIHLSIKKDLNLRIWRFG